MIKLSYRTIPNFTMQPGHGRYRTMIAANVLLSILLFIPVVAAELWTSALYWRRYRRGGPSHSMLYWKVGLLQRIYLGCDPQIWAALTGRTLDSNDSEDF